MFCVIRKHTLLHLIFIIKISSIATLTGVAQLVGALSHEAKGCQFNSQSGQCLCRQFSGGLSYGSPLFLSHTDVSLPLFLSPISL